MSSTIWSNLPRRPGLLTASLWLMLSAAWAQEDGAETDAEGSEAVTEEDAVDFIQHPFTPLQPRATRESPKEEWTAPVGVAPDPCDWDLSQPHLQEDSREVVRGITCHSFRWFDSLFGDAIDYPEDAINGLVTAGLEYTEYDGYDPRLKLRVRAPLPNMNKRWDLILGRGDDDSFISDTETQDETFYNPGFIRREQEESWLLGLGHHRGPAETGWDWSVGVRLRTPLEPYVKTQWLYYQAFSDRTELRFRQTFFWNSDDEFGTTSRGDISYGLDPENVMRWEGLVTISDSTEDFSWYMGQTWYHLLGDRGAFSILTFARGQTGAEVKLQEYGLNLIWRQPFTRDWLYLSMGPSITWPRFFRDEEREASLGFGAWIEMEFGHWRY